MTTQIWKGRGLLPKRTARLNRAVTIASVAIYRAHRERGVCCCPTCRKVEEAAANG